MTDIYQIDIDDDVKEQLIEEYRNSETDAFGFDGYMQDILIPKALAEYTGVDE